MNIPKPMNADEVFNFRLHLERMYPEESRSRLWLEAALVDEQHRRDMAAFVALLRGEAKRQAEEGSYTDVWRDDWALSYEFLADEIERAWSPNSRSNPCAMWYNGS